MNIVIENIRKVHYADISLKGLTVLTGHNDIGKSTVAKTIFSLLDIPYIIEKYLHEDFDVKLRKSFHSGCIQNTAAKNAASVISVIEDHNRLTFLFENENCKLVEMTDIYPVHYAAYINNNQLNRNYDERLLFATDSNYSDLRKDIVEFVDEISSIIGGTMLYKPMIQSLVLSSGDEYITDIQLSKQAFGILQMFCMTYFSMSPNPILILDEPETGLHPEWQLLYAKLITKIVKLGAIVLITSNSPYMIEALNHYSKEEKLEDFTSFYLGKKGDLGTVFQDATQNLDLLFELLAKPMRRLL